jgi:signal transduction histidine kinase
MTFEQVDALMDIQVRTASFHLWFEEAVGERRSEDVDKTFADIDAAVELSTALLSGGESEHRTDLTPLRDPAYLREAENIHALLVRLTGIALQRTRNLEAGGLGSALDEQFDAVFREFQERARALELAIEKERFSDRAGTRRLLFAIALIGAVIFSGSLFGLYSRERARTRAEQALEKAYAGMEERVRTAAAEKIVLQVETLRAAHLASIGMLAAGVAHEINNPINGIINYARILSQKSVKGSAENDVAERISKEGRRIAGIVKSLLSFARDGKEEKKPVTLAGILRESLTLTESQMRKEGIQVRIGIPPDLPEITANQQQIQQVFMNIINNAQYALRKKFPGEHEDKVLDITCEKVTIDDGPYVRIIFHDQGTGIASDALDKIINPFFSTKPKGEGTGLGLSISHGIVADHGGRLAVESVQGAYTKVQIDLPLLIAECGMRNAE